MFDVGFDELLVIVVVAIVVIGPKDMPKALRMAGKWIGKVRRVSGHFRSGVEAMIREAELEEMEAKWREQNAAILAAHPEQTPDSDAQAAADAANGIAPGPVMDALVPPTASEAAPDPQKAAQP
jgi:sec-independent protein translocase protein TatB